MNQTDQFNENAHAAELDNQDQAEALRNEGSGWFALAAAGGGSLIAALIVGSCTGIL